MAQMVKAVKMILGMNNFGSTQNESTKHMHKDIEVKDDAPMRKPTLEEIDALEVCASYHENLVHDTLSTFPIITN